MRILAVMAHYDALGGLAPHTARHIASLSRVCDRLVVVSTAGLDAPADQERVRRHAELVQRPNYGYDFYSWKVGLDSVEDLGSYDQVVITNDSFVGPLVPYEHIIETMCGRGVDMWGITQSLRRERHVQSYFVSFRRWLAGARAFANFWDGMTPESDRQQVITRYELGLSRTVVEAGFELGAYFEETPADRRLARARHLWWARHAVAAQPPARRRAAARKLPFEHWNPMAALADRALDDARLPLVKLDTLRYDPYRLGSDALLAACERRYPAEFAGVRDFLERTARAYPGRAGEVVGPVVPPMGVRQLIGYRS